MFSQRFDMRPKPKVSVVKHGEYDVNKYLTPRHKTSHGKTVPETAQYDIMIRRYGKIKRLSAATWKEITALIDAWDEANRE